jgi:hypothetical protein
MSEREEWVPVTSAYEVAKGMSDAYALLVRIEYLTRLAVDSRYFSLEDWEYHDAKELARIALETTAIKFSRWTA